MVALASLALQSAKKLFQKGNRVGGGELWRHSVGGSAVQHETGSLDKKPIGFFP